MGNIKINQIQLTGSLTSGDSFIVLDEETQATKRASLATISDYVKEDTLVHPAVDDMVARDALSAKEGDVVRVRSTGELFVYDGTDFLWRVIPNSSTKTEFFKYPSTSYAWINIYVDTNGNNTTGEGTEQNPFKSVSRALNSIPNGYKNRIYIRVAGGSYEDGNWDFPFPGATSPEDHEDPAGTSYPLINVVGMSPYTDGEQIQIDSSHTTANYVAHPSGNGNYAALSDFNFPTFTTQTNFNDDSGQYFLMSGLNTAYGNIPGWDARVVYKADNTTGLIRAVNQRNSNLYTTGTWHLVHKSQLPTFTKLGAIRNHKSNSAKVSIRNLAFDLTSVYGTTIYGSSVQAANVGFYCCYFNYGAYYIDNNESDWAGFQYCIFNKRSDISYSPLLWYKHSVRGTISNCYIKNTPVNVSSGQYQNLGGVYESTTSMTKLVTGTDDISTSHGAGPSVGISYFGAVDFIGPGVAMQFSNTSVRASAGSGNFSFSGVSNPLVLCNNSFWGHLNPSAIGDCTAPVIVGTKSMTGNAFTTTQAGPGIAGWNIINTVNPGQEVIVGAVTSSFAFSDLPQTDLILGTGSIGAIAR